MYFLKRVGSCICAAYDSSTLHFPPLKINSVGQLWNNMFDSWLPGSFRRKQHKTKLVVLQRTLRGPTSHIIKEYSEVPCALYILVRYLHLLLG